MRVPIIFAAGLVTGALSAVLILKKYYKAIANEEIESVKNSFNELKNNTKKDDATEPVKNEEPKSTVAKSSLDGTELHKYKKLVRDYGGAVKKTEVIPDPYVINPDEYAASNGYYKDVLVYYDEDNVLATEGDEVCLPERYVGNDFKDANWRENNFGRYEKDILHIRNEAITTDYEIQRVYMSYEAATGGYFAREEDS